MRVISGSCKGRRLAAPKSKSIRPALDQVKEAIFNILFDVEGKTVLDLFAGTGSMGIEALSRGAAHCVFVDSSREATALIRENLQRCGLGENAAVFAKNVSVAIEVLGRREEKFDLIFVDPPYLKSLVNPTLEKIADYEILAPDGVIVIEHHPKEPITPPAGLRVSDARKYGQTLITLLGTGKASGG